MNAGDLDALTALLLDTAIVETPGVRIDSGAEAARSGTLHGLVLGCVPEREDPRDAVVSRDGTAFADLPPGARVGTSSLRRVAQLRARGSAPSTRTSPPVRSAPRR